MKVRIKATGEIVEISTFRDNNKFPTTYDENELEFLIPDDYWTRLEHQAAIAAMQGILSNQDYCNLLIDNNTTGSFTEDISRCASDFAHALVEKYKKEERK